MTNRNFHCVLLLALGGCTGMPDAAGAGGSSSNSTATSAGAGVVDGGSDAAPDGACLAVGDVCGSGANAACGVRVDSCGQLTTCSCPEPMACLHEDRCCQSPALYNYEAGAAAKCALFPGYPTPAFCGEIPQYAPGSVDAGMPQPWLDKDGIPIEPPGQIPDYCVRAPYAGQPTVYVLWCCKP